MAVIGVRNGAASFALPGVDTFADGYSGNDQRRAGIGPPPAQGTVQDQADQQNGGKVRAEQGLLGIGDGGPGTELTPGTSLSPRQHRHDRQTQRSDNDARR
ncbi:hypothetical protein D3C73_1405490 [compost metagenome]